MNGSQIVQFKAPLPRTIIDRRGRRRHNNRSRGIDRRRINRRRIDRRRIDWRRRHNNRRANDAVHKRRSAEGGSCNTPSAMMVVMMMMEARTAMESRTAMEPTMEPRTRTGEHHTCRCHGHQHYYHFLVHVFLLFLSLLTMGMATSSEKSDRLFKKISCHSLARKCPE